MDKREFINRYCIYNDINDTKKTWFCDGTAMGEDGKRHKDREPCTYWNGKRGLQSGCNHPNRNKDK